MVAMCAVRAEDAGVEPKLVPTRYRGEGLAARYPGDVGIGGDRRVVLAESFESGDLRRRWKSINKYPGQLSLVGGKTEVHGGRRALKISYLRGENTGGHLYTSLDPGHERLFFRFYVRFPEGHGYVHHFVHMTGYDPPTPWPQGGAGQRPRGDERFSTGIDVFGDWGRSKPPGRWGFYSYWCEMKPSGDGRYWGNSPKGGKHVPVVTDRWICVEFMIRLNTVGKRDGEQAFWIDGKCAGHWTGYRWRTDPKLRINGIWLLYYMTDAAVRRSRGVPKDEHIFFDDIVVATEYIGPMKRRGGGSSSHEEGQDRKEPEPRPEN